MPAHPMPVTLPLHADVNPPRTIRLHPFVLVRGIGKPEVFFPTHKETP